MTTRNEDDLSGRKVVFAFQNSNRLQMPRIAEGRRKIIAKATDIVRPNIGIGYNLLIA